MNDKCGIQTQRRQAQGAGSSAPRRGCVAPFIGARDTQVQHVLVSTRSTFAESCAYDALVRRAWTWDGAETNFFVYDGNHVVAETDATGGLRCAYTRAPGTDRWLAMTVYTSPTNAPVTYTYITDIQGTVHALADESGSIAESCACDALGRRAWTWDSAETHFFVYDGSLSGVASLSPALSVERWTLGVERSIVTVLTSDLRPLTSSRFGNRILFQGREYDWATGFYYFRARWYDPVTGRWLSKNPIGISGGLNMYAFCGNDPVNYVDPYGLLTWSQVGYFAAGVAIGAAATVAIVATAPLAVSASVAAGVSATASSAIVTTGLAVGGGIGLIATGVNTYQNASIGNWNAVAYNAGTLIGGLGVGIAGGGRALAGLNGTPSAVPPSWNPFADIGLGYDPNFPGGNIPSWLGSAPTPSMGGLAATGVASGIGTIPSWFSAFGKTNHCP